jgi:hypothetical protein
LDGSNAAMLSHPLITPTMMIENEEIVY